MNRNLNRNLTRHIGAAVAIFLKSSKIVAAVKLFKFAKPMITMASLAISAVVYGFSLGWWFGGGLLVMLFVHEMGHIVALKQKGYAPSGPVFIPFLGAAIFLPEVGTRVTEAYIGIGGPILGTVGALVVWVAWLATGRQYDILLLTSFVGLYLNAFNMIPLSPLDGGRITQVLGPWFKWVGLAVLLGLTIWTKRPDLLLVWIISLDSFWFPRWCRTVFAVVLMFLMMGFILSYGYGDKDIDAFAWWLPMVDASLALVFIFLHFCRDYLPPKDDQKDALDARPVPSWGQRGKWAAAYLTLLVVLFGSIAAQVSSLPEGAR